MLNNSPNITILYTSWSHCGFNVIYFIAFILLKCVNVNWSPLKFWNVTQKLGCYQAIIEWSINIICSKILNYWKKYQMTELELFCLPVFLRSGITVCQMPGPVVRSYNIINILPTIHIINGQTGKRQYKFKTMEQNTTII
jgi:hypothetical protein